MLASCILAYERAREHYSFIEWWASHYVISIWFHDKCNNIINSALTAVESCTVLLQIYVHIMYVVCLTWDQ